MNFLIVSLRATLFSQSFLDSYIPGDDCKLSKLSAFHSIAKIKFLLSEREGHTEEYWPEVVVV